MSGPGARKALGQLVPGSACISGRARPHLRELLRLSGQCEHGHWLLGKPGKPVPAAEQESITICLGCWADYVLDIGDGSLVCGDCGHSCVLHWTANWEDGRSVTLSAMNPVSYEDISSWREVTLGV